MNRFLDFIDSRAIVRRIVLGLTVAMTWHVTVWAMRYAESSSRPGIDLAAIIAAVTAPATALGGYVFKSYVDSRGES